VPSDTYNVERIDFGKGSNSLIFGDVEPGGQGSVFTKRAQMKNFGNLSPIWQRQRLPRPARPQPQAHATASPPRSTPSAAPEKTFQDASLQAGGRARWPSRGAVQKHDDPLEAEQGEFHNARGFSGVTIREQSGRSTRLHQPVWWYTSDNSWFAQSTLPPPIAVRPTAPPAARRRSSRAALRRHHAQRRRRRRRHKARQRLSEALQPARHL
jgi:hypothetical protein